jgi:hypothetical protein
VTKLMNKIMHAENISIRSVFDPLYNFIFFNKSILDYLSNFRGFIKFG